METTANVGQPLSADVGNNIAADLVPDLNPEEDDPEDNNTLVTMATTLPTTSPTTRKWGSAISPDVLFSELKNMSASLSESMSAPLPPITFAPMAPTALIHMQACVLVQKHPDLEPQQLFDVIDFLALNNNLGSNYTIYTALKAHFKAQIYKSTCISLNINEVKLLLLAKNHEVDISSDGGDSDEVVNERHDNNHLYLDRYVAIASGVDDLKAALYDAKDSFDYITSASML
ncbi:hypothetical protein MJO29_003152 [Puccinia striiformis f. sp. tritici]|nr:hypothetical protein MJO29_003152 [Puccinia striiformis f. sp. tritici]